MEVDLKPQIVYTRIWILDDGNPKSNGTYFSNLGQMLFKVDSGWSTGGIPSNGISWWLMPQAAVIIPRSYLDTCDLDYIVIPTKSGKDDAAQG